MVIQNISASFSELFPNYVPPSPFASKSGGGGHDPPSSYGSAAPAALEIACFPCYYDPTRPDYLDIVKDKRISIPPYHDTLTSACTLGKETELVHMYAASAVIRMPIKSVHLVNNEHVQAWNRTVRGHDVSEDTHCKIQVLWSARAMPSDVTSFNPTHFVLLHRTAAPDQTTEVSDCDASGVEDMDVAAGK